LVQTVDTTLKKIYCDKYDADLVSYLSLFLYDEVRILLAKDANKKIMAIHTWNLFSSSEKPLSKVWRDELYTMDVPTRVFVHNKFFNLIPGAVFHSDFLATYLNFSSGSTSDLVPFSTGLDSNNIHLVGGIDNKLYQLLSDGKSKISFHHGATAFLSYCLSESSNFLQQEILIYLFDKAFYLAAFENQELKLFNRFDITDKDNFLSYLFGINKQLGFDRTFCKYTVFGKNEYFQISDHWAKNYFKNFSFDQAKSTQIFQTGTESFASNAHFESKWELT
jgi:hypothetical protein